MKTIVRNSIHKSEKSHDCYIAEIKNKKVKITYEAYNSGERCNVKIFDGDKWNQIFSIFDLGVLPNSSAYIKDADERKKYADELFTKAENMCKKIL